MEWPGPSPNPWTTLAGWLRALPGTLPHPPRAVLVISGHWEAEPVAVNVQTRPALLFDYYGFPEHTYRLKYPAPGDPQLARNVRELLAAGGFASSEEQQRGLCRQCARQRNALHLAHIQASAAPIEKIAQAELSG